MFNCDAPSWKRIEDLRKGPKMLGTTTCLKLPTKRLQVAICTLSPAAEVKALIDNIFDHT